MISTLSLIAVYMAKTAFFWPSFILGESQDDHDKRTETFLADDEFNEETLTDPNNYHLIKVLNNSKDEYRKNYYEQLNQLSIRTETHTYNQLDRIFKYNRIQIMRLRLLIQPDTIISVNKTYNREQKYSVVRAYWIENSGKKVIKFNVNLGNTEKVMDADGTYDQHLIKLAKYEIKSKMLGTYTDIYGPIPE